MTPLAPLQTPVTFARPVQFAVTLLGFAVTAAVTAGAAAVVYRWYTREPISDGVPALLAVSVVALYLNTVALIGNVTSGEMPGLFSFPVVLANLASVGVALAIAPAGRRLGDRLATDVFALTGAREFEGDVGRLVRSVGRVTVVRLPDEIDDTESHDPVSDRVKEELAGRTLLFPSRLTEAELRNRFARRLKDDYGVGYVDVEFAEDGDVEYLGLGGRIAGLGPTLANGTVAVAVRADPPNDASPGDVVQVWEAGEGDAAPSRVAAAELRAAVDDVVTLAVDESDAPKLRPDRAYRLVTMPVSVTPDREFATLLRGADETMGTVTVTAGSELDGATVGDLGTTVIAVRPDGAAVDPIPPRSRTLAPGETVYAVARPEVLRRLEAAASAPASEPAADGDPS